MNYYVKLKSSTRDKNFVGEISKLCSDLNISINRYEEGIFNKKNIYLTLSCSHFNDLASFINRLKKDFPNFIVTHYSCINR